MLPSSLAERKSEVAESNCVIRIKLANYIYACAVKCGQNNRNVL